MNHAQLTKIKYDNSCADRFCGPDSSRSKYILLIISILFIISSCSGSNNSSDGIPTDDDNGQSQFIKVIGLVAEGGIITPDEQEIPLLSFTSFELTPESGYSIESVSGCPGLLAGNIYTTEILESDCVVIATFSRDGIQLVADIFGQGSIMSDQNICESDSPCVWHRPLAEQVVLRAEAAPGWELDHWAGCGSVTGDVCTVTMDNKKSVTAYFAQIGDLVLKPEVLILTENQLNALISSSDDALIFNNTVSELSLLPIGTILVSTRDSGFARRISQIVPIPDGYTIIQTRQVAAEDVVESGTLLWSSAEIDEKSIKFVPSQNNRARVEHQFGLSPRFDLDVVLYTDADSTTGRTTEVALTGDVKLDLNLDYALDFGSDGINEIKMSNRINVEPSLHLSMEAIKNIPIIDVPISIGTFYFPPVFVGPLVIVFGVDTFVTFDSKIGGNLGFETGISIAGISGFHYRKNEGWTYPHDLSLSINGFDIIAEPLDANLGLWLNERASAKLWNIAGPEQKIGPIISADLTWHLPDFPVKPSGCLSAEAYLGGKVEISGKVRLFDWSLPFPKYTAELGLMEIYKDDDLLSSNACVDQLLGAPQNLFAENAGSRVSLEWAPPDSTVVTDYAIFRNGEFLGQAFGTRYEDEISQDGIRVCYQVFAVNHEGELSPPSNEQCVEPMEQTIVPPSEPINLTVTGVTSNTAQLNWEYTDDSTVSGFLVMDSESTNVIDRVEGLEMLINRLQSNTRYCFTVSAINNSGEQSETSNEVCSVTRPIDAGEWQVNTRCDNYAEYAFNSPLDINASTNGLVSATGTARDYLDDVVDEGPVFGYIISGYLDPDSKLLTGTISFTFESGGYRQDRFEADLSDGDSGDVLATLIEHTSEGCGVVLRFRRTDSTNKDFPDIRDYLSITTKRSFREQLIGQFH